MNSEHKIALGSFLVLRLLYISSSEKRLETFNYMRKCIVDGQKEEDIPNLWLKNDYNYKIRKPSAQVSKVFYPGIQSFVTFTHTMSSNVLVNNIFS